MSPNILDKMQQTNPTIALAHFRRAALGLLGMFLNFGAVTLLPLAEATTLNFTTAIWAVILSALILRERVGLLLGLPEYVSAQVLRVRARGGDWAAACDTATRSRASGYRMRRDRSE